MRRNQHTAAREATFLLHKFSALKKSREGGGEKKKPEITHLVWDHRQTGRHRRNVTAETPRRWHFRGKISNMETPNQHEEWENVHPLQRDLDTETFSWCAALFFCCTHMPKNHVWSDYDSDSETSKRRNSIFHNPSSGWTVRILCNRRGCFSF